MSKLISLIFLAGVLALSSSGVRAEELSIVGNGSGTQNSVTVNSGSSLNLYQQNSADISTRINASAETGGNSASGGTGGATIQTGDSTIDIKVTNILNSNLNQVNCCDPSATPTPDPVQPISTPSPSSSTADPASSSSSGGSSGGTGTAPVVLGLSATSSSDPTSALVASLGLICLSTAGMYLKSALAL
jgi:hypothetical protein